MKTRAAGTAALLLIISAANYVVILKHSHIRAVEFLSILVIGILSGILLTQIIALIKKRM
jgi:hypothetical protein